jgi:CHAT domain-containing protein
LRTDLVAVNPAVQFSFQESVEPIHRELVSLILSPEREASAADLETARETIEALQLAELDNFFREACLDATAVDIDRLDQRAAVIYPVILSDRLEVILSLPDQSLQHYATPVSASDFNQTIESLQQFLVLRVGNQYLPYSQQLYDWLIRPLVADLSASPVDTLVFVLDGELRNIPMSALHDGEQFLLEKYNLALTPGLQLVNPRPLQSQTLRVLTAGLSESRLGFSALPNVINEVNQIQSTVPTAAVLLNETFTVKALSDSLTVEGSPIVHLATHGQFSSSNQDTFVLTWNDRLNINTLNDLLQTSELNENGPIELLVLSACETATGDKQAALGMAGMAVRSGARSTIATLWQINDEATAELMSALYQQLAN